MFMRFMGMINESSNEREAKKRWLKHSNNDQWSNEKLTRLKSKIDLAKSSTWIIEIQWFDKSQSANFIMINSSIECLEKNHDFRNFSFLCFRFNRLSIWHSSILVFFRKFGSFNRIFRKLNSSFVYDSKFVFFQKLIKWSELLELKS